MLSQAIHALLPCRGILGRVVGRRSPVVRSQRSFLSTSIQIFQRSPLSICCNGNWDMCRSKSVASATATFYPATAETTIVTTNKSRLEKDQASLSVQQPLKRRLQPWLVKSLSRLGCLQGIGKAPRIAQAIALIFQIRPSKKRIKIPVSQSGKEVVAFWRTHGEKCSRFGLPKW